jgi:hypothetical protein
VQFTTTRDEDKLTGVYGTGRVTVVDRNDALAHREDRDVSEALRGLFDDRTSVNDNLPPNGYRITVNTRQNGGIVSATSMRISRLHHE